MKSYWKLLIIGLLVLLFGASIASSINSNKMVNNSKYSNIDVVINNIGPGVEDFIILDTVGIWHFDEGSGPNAYDSSEYKNHGECFGTQWTDDTPDGSPYALSFSAEYNSVVIVEHDPSLDFDDLGEGEGFMIDFWMAKRQTPTISYAGLVCKQNYGGYMVRLNENNKIEFIIWDVKATRQDIDSNTIIFDNDWHHIVAVWDGTTLYLYIDDMTDPDNSKYVGNFTLGVAGLNKWLDIGNDWPTDNYNPFDGLIDEVYIHKIFLNDPPNIPIITGPPEGKVGEGYDFTFIAFDPEDQKIYFYIDWGDDSVIDWFGPYDSGEPITISHTWTKKDNYVIKAKAKDIYEAESEWGTLDIKIPRSSISIITSCLRFFDMFPILQILLQRLG